MKPLAAGERYIGTVEGYTSEGHGVVRLDGAVVFVPGTVRGERVEIQIIKTGKRAATGEAVQILDSSPWRRKPDCPWFGQCGGCDFRHLSYEEELLAKRRRVEDALRRIGGAAIPVEEILGAANPLAYRSKSQYPVGPDGTVGFYRAGSHQTVAVRDCRIQPGAANRTAEAVQSWIQRYGVSCYDEKTGRGLVRHVFVRVNRLGESLCCIVANGKALPREPELVGMVRAAAPDTVGVLVNSNTRPGNVVLGEKYRTLWGQDFLLDTLRGLTFRLSVPSFFQVNREQAEILYGKVLEYAGLSTRDKTGGEEHPDREMGKETGREAGRETEKDAREPGRDAGKGKNADKTVLDLYCGVGTITLCLAQRTGRVIGAEIVAQAVADARENAKRNGVTNVEFLCADAADAAAHLAASGLRPDVVTVDPPRKGLPPDAIAAIASMRPERVVYISCDPGTLGRDVGRFAEQGYQAVRAAAVDMFPGTKHVETVVLLTRNT